MKKYFVIAIVFFATIFMSPVFAAKKIKTNHPLVKPYIGSSLYSKDVKKFDEYKVFKGWSKDTKKFITQVLEGKVTKLLYKNPKDRSILEIYRNYESAFKKDGVDILYQCNQSNMECMDRYVGSRIRTEFGIHSIGNKSGRYIFAKLDKGEQIAYIILSVGKNNTDVHIIEMKKMEIDKVELNLNVLSESLEDSGFVVVEGIYFDTDKTDLQPQSKPAIDEVAKLLKSMPELKLYVVGHTDIKGSLSHNMILSQGRAKSVVRELVNNYSIAEERLEGRGVGPLSPISSNTHENGRSQNRRVVLVQR